MSENKLVNFVDLLREPGDNLEFFLDCLDFLLDKVLFVFGKSHGHDVVIVLDFTKHALNGVLGVVKDLLPLGQIVLGSIEIKALLDLLDLLLALLEFNDNGLESSSITFPGSFGVVQKLQTSRGLVLGFIPSLLDSANMAVQELGFVWVFHKLLALGDQVLDNGPLGFKLSEGLFLSLDQLFDVFNAAGSNVTGGAEHDSIQEFNMGFQLITESVTFPVEIDLDLSFGYSGDEVLVLLDESLQFLILHGFLIF